VRGVGRLHGAEHTIIPDRIEAGTFLIAGAITGGDLLVSGCNPEHLAALIAKLRQAGVEISGGRRRTARAWRAAPGQSVDVVTEEYPGFATDLQAQYMALMTQADGISFITETIFENRFMHALELARMGANIRVEGRQAIVAGPRR
jgi:UDP-N-acetylglucosamine 1-carboxyvinyltransferase